MTAKLREAQARGAELVRREIGKDRAMVLEQTALGGDLDGSGSGGDDHSPASLLEGILRAMFQKADIDGNGVLDAQEFAQVLHAPALGLNLAHGQTARLMEAVDTDRNGRVDWREFVVVFRSLLKEMVSEDESKLPAIWKFKARA